MQTDHQLYTDLPVHNQADRRLDTPTWINKETEREIYRKDKSRSHKKKKKKKKRQRKRKRESGKDKLRQLYEFIVRQRTYRGIGGDSTRKLKD